MCLVRLSDTRQFKWNHVSFDAFFQLFLTFFFLFVCAFRDDEDYAGFGLRIVLMVCALILGVLTVANLYTWSKLLRTVFFSQRRHLQRSIAKLETLKSEGFLQTLRQEVRHLIFLS